MSKRTISQSLSRSDEVTVMVFKDNDTSRSFQVSLGWITRLGFALGAILVAAMLSTFFALKYYRVARKSDSSRVESLEQQLADLKSSNKTLEVKLASTAASLAAANNATPLPVPTVTVTVAAPAPAAPVANVLTPPPTQAIEGGSILLFSALPKQTRDLSSSSAKLPIAVSAARTSWTKGGKSLGVTFNIQYTGTDHGSQQGRIIVLARGPAALFAYPSGALGKAGTDALIAPAQGEYFSVSRFREVKADFPDARGFGPIQDAEILVMSQDGELLSYQKAVVTPPNAATPKAAPVKAAPAASSSGTPPGADGAIADPAKAPPGDSTATEPKAAAPSKPKNDSSELIEPGTDQ